MATLTDIAEKTGFSMMTVSRCFNAPEKVKPETLEIVLKVAKECNYVPNTVARSLAKRETKIIYVYIPQGLDVSHPFVMQAVASIGEELGKYGYSFLMSRNFYSNESCDGVIAMGLTVDDEDEFIKISAKKPAIAFGNSSKFKNWVDVDNYRGSYLMAEYIFEKGYTNVLYVGIDNLENYSKQRLNGYCDCAKKYALDQNISHIDTAGGIAVIQHLGAVAVFQIDQAVIQAGIALGLKLDAQIDVGLESGIGDLLAVEPDVDQRGDILGIGNGGEDHGGGLLNAEVHLLGRHLGQRGELLALGVENGLALLTQPLGGVHLADLMKDHGGLAVVGHSGIFLADGNRLIAAGGVDIADARAPVGIDIVFLIIRDLVQAAGGERADQHHAGQRQRQCADDLLFHALPLLNTRTDR